MAGKKSADPGTTRDVSETTSVGKTITQTFKNRMSRGKLAQNARNDETVAMTSQGRRTGSTTQPSSQPKVEVRKVPGAKSRRARLRISRIDPWSVMKTALLFGVAGWIMFIVASFIVFTVLEMTGLYEAINSTVEQIFASPEQSEDFNIQDYVNTTRGTALAALVGAVNVVIITALATIFAFLYNLTAVVMGGIEVTMAED